MRPRTHRPHVRAAPAIPPPAREETKLGSLSTSFNSVYQAAMTLQNDSMGCTVSRDFTTTIQTNGNHIDTNGTVEGSGILKIIHFNDVYNIEVNVEAKLRSAAINHYFGHTQRPK